MSSPWELPDDIIREILHRLSVTCLLRFSSVSKSWNAWIKSSSFISAHHQIRKNMSCSYLVCIRQWGPRYCALIPETSAGEPTQISFPPLPSNAGLVGSSEGLVCFRARSIIYVWNPFIRTLKQIKSMGQFHDPGEKLGFGFAPQRADYMIVKPLREEGYLTGAEIYSLSLDSWTRIKAPEGMSGRRTILHLGSQVSSNGSIYWLTYCSGHIYMILRFDLDTGKIEKIEIDTKAHGALTRVKNEIMLVNGFLVLLEFGSRGRDVIPVKGYIYKESELGSSSWTSTTTVDLPIGITDMIWPTIASGRVVLEKDGRLFAFDCYCDGKDLNFKLRDLGINAMTRSPILLPIRETLHLLAD